jgi:hypothetical protein
MTAHVLVWDLEAVADLRGFAAANGLDGNAAFVQNRKAGARPT